MKANKSMKIIYVLINLIILINYVESLCHLPLSWSGKWYQSKDSDLLHINKTNFINRGSCIEQKQDKYLFYESKEDCFRCIFIMQKHTNVLQYRASYCTEQSDFYSNCQNLSPESELITIYRDDSQAEKCPLGGLYVLTHPMNSIESDDRISQRSSQCTENQETMIMECSDQSMLKLQFGRCTNMPTFIVNCMAHWTEGNTNYLIGRVTSSSQKSTYRCLVYTSSTDSSLSDSNQIRQTRNSNSDSFIDFINKNDNTNLEAYQSTIQLSISPDEFCRNLESDDQASFTFTKVLGSKYHVAPPTLNDNRRNRRQLNANHTHKLKSPYGTCKFPKWLNKNWHNLKQTKLFSLEYKLDSLIVQDEKNSIVINKYTCSQMKIKKHNYVQAIVKSLNGCSSGYQCLTITAKSDFVLEIKFGKISYSSSAIDCSESNHISQEFVYVDTNYGVKCPLKNGLYEKIDAKTNTLQRALPLQSPHSQHQQQNEACKYLTQTQTLQVGCQNEQQYSLRTKLCYPNQQYNLNTLQSSPSTTAYTQLESEINLVCLAHWRQDGNHVIVSRTMSNEILCSIWSMSDDGRFLQLLEIDSNCNYSNNSKKRQGINYGFVFINSCDEQASAYASVPTSSSSSSLLFFNSSKFYLVSYLLFKFFYVLFCVNV